MLDISIPQLRDVLCREERQSQVDARIQRFVNTRVTITEKFDGTKLTFLKTGDGDDNWLVAYKGNVLPKELFKKLILEAGNWRLTPHAIRNESAGFLQYIFVFDHLFSLDARLWQIPANTEVLLEFIQRKPTVLSEYKRLHSAFIIAASPCDWHLDSTGTQLTTFAYEGNAGLTDRVVRGLGLRQPPILFDGRLCEPKVHGSLLDLPEIDGHTGWVDYLQKLESALTGFESSAGGKPEGVVLRTIHGDMFKVVRKDQYDKSARSAKKAKFKYDDDTHELAYWAGVHDEGTTWARDEYAKSIEPDEVMRGLAQRAMFFRPRGPIAAPRTEVTVTDDVLLTAKLAAERLLWTGTASSIGVFVMAGKPVHLGHWKMIKRAAYENDKLLLIVSTGDRGEVSGHTMFQVWNKILIDKLPKNVVLRFSSSPYVNAIRELKSLAAETTARLAVYGDPHDIEKSWNPDVIRKKLPELADDRLWVFPIARESVVEISGTEMRKHIRDLNKEEFVKNLPNIPEEQKQQYWDIVTKGFWIWPTTK